MSPEQVILRLAELTEAFAWQAGVGGMETAGSMVSYLAEHPEKIGPFLSGRDSMIDWPIGWHEQGRLTWHAQNGKIISPEFARRQRVIVGLSKGKRP